MLIAIYLVSLVLCFILFKRYNSLQRFSEDNKIDFHHAFIWSILPGINTLVLVFAIADYVYQSCIRITKIPNYEKLNNWFKGK